MNDFTTVMCEYENLWYVKRYNFNVIISINSLPDFFDEMPIEVEDYISKEVNG